MTDAEYMARRAVWDWQFRADNFASALIALIAGADEENRQRLALGFPEHVKAYTQWDEAPKPQGEAAFWREWLLYPVEAGEAYHHPGTGRRGHPVSECAARGCK